MFPFKRRIVIVIVAGRSRAGFDPALVATCLRLDAAVFGALIEHHRASERFAV